VKEKNQGQGRGDGKKSVGLLIEEEDNFLGSEPVASKENKELGEGSQEEGGERSKTKAKGKRSTLR